MGEDGPQSRIEQVCAVVVAYYPDECLAALIAELSPQVGAIVVVDNTPEGGAAAASTKQAALITLGNNLGIAAVHNRGIDWAREQGYVFVLLMDQGSQPDDGMVVAQLAAFDQLIEQSRKIAALAPRFHDARYGVDAPFIQLHDYRIARVGCEPGQGPVEAAYVISSGSLIPMATLDAVGPMQEDLFIDYALFTPPRLEQVKMMSRGMWDGLRGRMGRYRGG